MSKFYKPGDVIYSGKPFAQVANYEQRKLFCDNCLLLNFGFFAKLKVCTSCRYVYYCSKQCQRAAWTRHKLECPLLCNIPEEKRDRVRFVGQVILLLKGKDWKSISEPVGNTQMSFYDLVSNTEYTKNDPELSLEGLEVVCSVKQYLREANVFTDDEIIEIYGKVKHNCFEVRSGFALYIGASLFNHACIPNANRLFKENTITIRALVKLPQDDIKKVTVPYIEFLYADVYPDLKKCFYGPCECDDCSLPYGDSKLTKILDKTRAWSVIECTKETLVILRACETSDNSIFPEILQLIKELLNKQRNVLGDSNLLRMKMLLKKATYENNLLEKFKDYKKVAQCVEETFGENSVLLRPIYDSLSLLPHPEAMIYVEKGRRLRALLGLNE